MVSNFLTEAVERAASFSGLVPQALFQRGAERVIGGVSVGHPDGIRATISAS